MWRIFRVCNPSYGLRAVLIFAQLGSISAQPSAGLKYVSEQTWQTEVEQIEESKKYKVKSKKM